MILSSVITELVAHTKWSAMTTPSAPPEALHANPEERLATLGKATKAMTPDRALAVAIKSLADHKVELFERHKIEMNPRENDLSWAVWFVGLPEAPGMELLVTLANDGRPSVFLGAK
jgi:hypothetical protein